MSSKVKRHGNVEGYGMCCGLAEYDGLNYESGFTVEGVIAAIAEDGFFRNTVKEIAGDGFCQVVLTQAIYMKDGKRPSVKAGTKRLHDVVAYIKKHKLGSVVMTAAKTNPNSGNPVKGALFAPSRAAMKRWMIANDIPAGDFSYRSDYYW